MPTPIKKEPNAAQTGPSSGDNVRKTRLPNSKEAPPTKDVRRKPILKINFPDKVDAIGQPIDMVVNAKPAIKADSSITPCTNVGKKEDNPIKMTPVVRDTILAMKMDRSSHMLNGIIGSLARCS